VYRELERGNNAAYWEDITIVVEEELRTLHKLEFAGTGLHHFSCGTLVCVFALVIKYLY
jgi:hypothetical protein